MISKRLKDPNSPNSGNGEPEQEVFDWIDQNRDKAEHEAELDRLFNHKSTRPPWECADCGFKSPWWEGCERWKWCTTCERNHTRWAQEQWREFMRRFDQLFNTGW